MCKGGDFIVGWACTILRDDVAQEFHTGGSDRRFVRRDIQPVEGQSCEEGREGRYLVNGRIGRIDCIIEIRSDVVEASRDEAYDGDKPSRGAGGALRHA